MPRASNTPPARTPRSPRCSGEPPVPVAAAGPYHQPRLLSRPAMNPPRLPQSDPRNTARLEFKIVPPQLYGLPLGEIGGALRLLDEDFTLPAALVRDDILRHNSTWMRRFSCLEAARESRLTARPRCRHSSSSASSTTAPGA